MMYDELIKRLRSVADKKREFNIDLFLEDIAADAIEDLQKQLQKSEEDNVNLTGWLAEEHAKHLWIPVTERLPEENGHYLVHAVGNGYYSTYIALWNGRFRANFEMPITHWMPLPQPPEDK